MGDVSDEVRLTLRLPAALRDRLTKEAGFSGRSLNAEMVQRLEKTLVDEDKVAELEDQMADLWGKMEDMGGKVSELWAVYHGRDPYNDDD
jgi:hypothetical protein